MLKANGSGNVHGGPGNDRIYVALGIVQLHLKDGMRDHGACSDEAKIAIRNRDRRDIIDQDCVRF